MKEIAGDFWEYLRESDAWGAITTNGRTRGDGAAVMGRGVALQAAQRHPFLPKELGLRLDGTGNHVYAFPGYRLLTLPVKVSWQDRASLPLIIASLWELQTVVRALAIQHVLLVRPGCGNGGLEWAHVRPYLTSLPDTFTVVERTP